MTLQDLGRRWEPKDAAELLDAFNGGFLAETHWCDLKRELGSNRESAKDMSAFSIDGGTIVIGIDEKKPDGEPRHPVTLRGLPEKLEQIAQMSIHPPLQITCTTIESGEDDGKGYVLVHIPASALAPHQVDGVYYARSDVTTGRMSEPEVERLYQRRTRWDRDATDLLDKHMGQNFTGRPHPPFLYVVARPVGGWPDMCRSLVSGPDWRGKIDQLKFNIAREESVVRLLREFGLHPRDGLFCVNMLMSEKTDMGALLSSRVVAGQPPTGPDRRLEISENGEMRLFFNAVHQDLGVNGVRYVGLELASVVLIVRELAAVARYLSNRCGHSTMWDFALGLDGMSDVRPIADTSNRHYSMDHSGYPAMEYRQATRASVLELEKAPGAVAERLAGRLYRTFDVIGPRFLTVFSDVAEQADAAE